MFEFFLQCRLKISHKLIQSPVACNWLCSVNIFLSGDIVHSPLTQCISISFTITSGKFHENWIDWFKVCDIPVNVLHAPQWKHRTDTSACINTVINLLRKACPCIQKLRDLDSSFCMGAIRPGFTAQKPLNQGSHSIKQEATRGQYPITDRHLSVVQTRIASSRLHSFCRAYVQTL